VSTPEDYEEDKNKIIKLSENMTENKKLKVKDQVIVDTIIFHGNNPEDLINFNPIFCPHKQFECEKEPPDLGVWSMTAILTKHGDIEHFLSYKKPNPVEIKSMDIKNNLNILKK